MRIKELHLRNIASIEVADIDFEKGLIDGVTGDPASIFLISGDTGAGKSVILDGIALALYKKTPRTESVNDSKRNNYTNKEGETIRVCSIEQYTRLGISPKDECYSEVVFEGNDKAKTEYTARLTLGLTKSNKKDKDGNYPIHYSEPVWKVTNGTEEWQKDDARKVILDAIGLTFEQFGRMAMLAQGQFAAFLTGSKKERELILEQLTNTEKFSTYGDAINRIYKRAADKLERCNTVYETEKEHRIIPEDVDKKRASVKELKEKKKALDIKAKENDIILDLVSTIERCRQSANSHSKKKEDLDAVISGDKYKSSIALIADWDATTTERQNLANLKIAKSSLAKMQEEEQKDKSKYHALLADLAERNAILKAKGNPQDAVDAKQKEIDNLKQQIIMLNPEQINNNISENSKALATLSTLKTCAENIEKQKEVAAKMENEIGEMEHNLADQKATLEQAEKKQKDAEAEYDKANNIFTTMKTSVDEVLINIRKRMVDEHAEICPLCGQHINEFHFNDEFKSMLTPYEKEREKTKQAHEQARSELATAQKAVSSSEGSIATNRDNLRQQNAEIDRQADKLRKNASQFGIDITGSLDEQISSVKSSLEERQKELERSQKLVQDTQNKFNTAVEEKKPLDKALESYKNEQNIISNIETTRKAIVNIYPEWEVEVEPRTYPSSNIQVDWSKLSMSASNVNGTLKRLAGTIEECQNVLTKYYSESGKDEKALDMLASKENEIKDARDFVNDTDTDLKSTTNALDSAYQEIKNALAALGVTEEKDAPEKNILIDTKDSIKKENDDLVGKIRTIEKELEDNEKVEEKLAELQKDLDDARATYEKWSTLNGYFGGTRFRTLVQTYILRPLLNNANIYLEKITDRYTLTCSEDNEQLSILVLDKYNKNQVRSVTVLSGGERFMISLALSLALSSLNRPDMNVNILFIDEGFGTLDENSLDSVMSTLERLQEIAGESERRVGIISHREELDDRIPVQIHVKKKGEGRSHVIIKNSI